MADQARPAAGDLQGMRRDLASRPAWRTVVSLRSWQWDRLGDRAPRIGIQPVGSRSDTWSLRQPKTMSWLRFGRADVYLLQRFAVGSGFFGGVSEGRCAGDEAGREYLGIAWQGCSVARVEEHAYGSAAHLIERVVDGG